MNPVRSLAWKKVLKFFCEEAVGDSKTITYQQTTLKMKKTASNRVKQSIWLVLLFFFLIFAIFNDSLFRSETFVITSRAALSEVSSETSVNGENISLQSIRLLAALRVDFDFLKSEEFSSLVINGDIPIKPQAEGRTNPFLPY